VIPIFILDTRLLDPEGRFMGAMRVRFMLESLRVLARQLAAQGSGLVLRRGEPQTELVQLVRQTGAQAVYWNRDYSPYGQQRDAAVARALHELGCAVQQFKDAVLFEAGELLTRAGTPYTVYTPYARQWRQQLDEQGLSLAAVPRVQRSAAELPASQPVPELAELGLASTQQAIAGGAEAGQALLGAFTDLRHRYSVATYHDARDTLAAPGTSRLSAHLRLGSLSPRACVQAAQDVAQRDEAAAPGVHAWIGELAWRDFYVNILASFPHVLRRAFRSKYDAIAWENDPNAFAAWCAGRTGYPIVDAAMRQLNQEGWMHNRARMIVASFLTKDLLIDWRWGERYFMQQLVDGDPAANNGGWQWAAGTGTDAQPYFRIFNPVSQGRRFDADGDYVRHYLPELARVPARAVHEPWKLSAEQQRQSGVQIGADYPEPIVEHATQRKRALELYGVVKQQD
jgi:deoxyribodipyrimidine photo-lyase